MNNNESNSFELKEGKINIHKSSSANDENKQPQYFGSCKVKGVEYKISLWVSTSNAGNKYFAGNIQDANKPEAVADEKPTETSASSDLPF